MASGGARGNAGRPLDPNSLNAAMGKHDDVWLTLSKPSGVIPEWPLMDQSDRESTVWARLWLKPQATEWLRLGLEDEVALYTRYLVEAEKPEAAGNTRTLVKQYQELLGLSTAGLKRLQWQMPASDSPVASAGPAVKKRASSRGRLSVVPDDGA